MLEYQQKNYSTGLRKFRNTIECWYYEYLPYQGKFMGKLYKVSSYFAQHTRNTSESGTVELVVGEKWSKTFLTLTGTSLFADPSIKHHLPKFQIRSASFEGHLYLHRSWTTVKHNWMLRAYPPCWYGYYVLSHTVSECFRTLVSI